MYINATLTAAMESIKINDLFINVKYILDSTVAQRLALMLHS